MAAQAFPSGKGPDAALPTASDDAASATAHMARFEFSDLGTKVLMVEWHPGPSSSSSSSSSSSTAAANGGHLMTPSSGTVAAPALGPLHAAAQSTMPARPASSTGVLDAAAWEVSWPGKSTFLPARESDHDEAGPRRRVYFLLPPETSIPAQVTIANPGRARILVKPLPAIFPPGFNVEAGTRGVLHTLWAKKRLSELDREMDAEMRANAESVGLEMAMAEREWIVQNFLPCSSPSDAAASAPVSAPAPAAVAVPKRGAVPGRLGDRLRGLRLATSPADLVPGPTANTFTGADIPSQGLSPHGSDVAVSSFAAIPLPRRAAPLNPGSRDGEDELFALPLSPRSPEMERGPFGVLSA